MTRRFYNGSGKFVGINKLFNSVISLYQALIRKVFNYYPKLPWIPFEIVRELDKLIQPTWVVYEIGSGMSTLWLSERSASVTSIEASQEWFDRLSKLIAAAKITNVNLKYEWVAERMSDFSNVLDASLDLLFVDGGPRASCTIHGFGKVKSGGYIYLDNWDTPVFYPRIATFMEEHKDEIEWSKSFTDYVPGSFGVYEGLLIRKR